MEGRISIHRKILDREWYDDINTKVLFIHLLLTVNIKDKQWRWKTIERWSRITSIAKLSKEIWLSIKQIRLSLDKLISTSEIDKQTTNEYTKLSITKYNDYQGKEWRKRANERQTEGKQRATTKEDKNIINKENNEYTDAFEMFWKSFPHARKWKKKESFDYYKKLNADDIALEINNLNWSIKFWLQDWKYVPACERWIRDFTKLSDLIKEQNIKTYVFKLMEMPIWDKRKWYYSWLCNDFWKDVIDKYVNQWNSERNWITLNLK